MKLSDAILAGTLLLKTRGPSWDDDCWSAAAAGLLGAVPTPAQVAALYWDNPWNIAPGSDMEMWLRGTVRESYRWFQVIQKLQAYSA